MNENLPVRIHFASGQSVDTAFTVDEDVDVEVEDAVEAAIRGEGKPHWTWVGDVYLYTQAVAGVEIL